MPVYQVTDPSTGRKVRLTGDSPPTDEELESIFSNLPEPKPKGEQLGSVENFKVGMGRGFTNAAEGLEQAAREASLKSTENLEQAETGGNLDRFLSGAEFAANPIQGLVGLFQKVVGNDSQQQQAALRAFNDAVQKERDYHDKTYAGQSTAGKVGEFVGEVAPALAVPAGSGSLAARAGYGALTGAGVGGTQFVEEGGSRAENTALGGAFGAAAPVVVDKVLKPVVNKAVNAVKGAFADDGAQALVEAGKKHETPVFLTDIVNSPLLKKLDVQAENVPIVGTSGGRLKQAEAAKQAAKKILADMGDDGDFYQGIQKGMQEKLTKLRSVSKQMYERVGNELKDAGDVPTPKMDSIVDDLIAKESKFGSVSNNEAIQVLKSFKDAPKGDFEFMRALRSKLSDEIADFYKGDSKAIGQKGVNSLQALKKALDDDLADFATSKSDKAGMLWRQADKFYRERIAEPFKKSQLKNLVNTEEPEKAWRFLVASTGIKSRQDLLYKSLDDAGRQNVKLGLVKTAYDKALNENRVFSPAKFAKYLEDHSEVVDRFFRGKEKKEIQGFVKLMRHVERAGQVAENPPNGSRLLLPVLVGAASVEPAVAGGMIGSAGFLRVLTHNETVRNLLLASSKTTPGTAAFERIMERLGDYLARTGAIDATQQSK